MSDKIKTSAEKRAEKIAQLKAQLQKEQSKQNNEIRKERNGQLIAFGVYIEEFYKTASEEEKSRLLKSIQKFLKGRNLDRALQGFARLDS